MTSEYRGPKCDLHTHILPKNWPNLKKKYGYGGWIQLEHSKTGGKSRMMKDSEFFREVEANCYDPEAILKDMDHSGVNVQVVCTVPVMFSYWANPEHCADISRFLNDDIHELVKKIPKRFVGLGTIPMCAPVEAVNELKRCVEILGFPGIQIGSNINQKNLNDPVFEPIWETANKMGCCIFVHPWEMMGKHNMEKYWLPWLVGMPAETCRAICSLMFGGVFDRYPNIKWCFAHSGGSFPATIGRIEHGWRVRPDICQKICKKNPMEYMGKFWIDSITHNEEMLKYCINLVGENRIVLGSDYPFPLGELEFGHYPGKLIEESKLSGECKHLLLWKNAMELLGLNEVEYMSEKIK